MTQKLRVCTVLAKDRSLHSRTHVKWLKTACYSSYGTGLCQWPSALLVAEMELQGQLASTRVTAMELYGQLCWGGAMAMVMAEEEP